MDPKITIIMGIYNCAKTLPDAIDSILNQTITDWQLIMCDDGSVDNTYEVAYSYQKLYPDKIIVVYLYVYQTGERAYETNALYCNSML